MTRLPKQTALAAVAGLLALPLQAGVIQTNAFTEGSNTAYDANASSSDLINQGAASLGGFTSSLPGTWPASGTNDGSATGGGVAGDYAYWDQQTTVTLTYELTGSATGYDITSINSIYGWDESRRHAAQYYSVYVATVADPNYTLLHTVAYDPITAAFVPGSSQVTLTDTEGVLAKGVTGIRFIAIEDPGGLYDEVGVIHEFDVFGIPSVPEPGSLAVLAVSGLLIMRRRRRG